MKKSILFTCAFVIVLSLIVGDRFLLKLDSSGSENQTEMAAGAEAPVSGLVTIEDEAVPLAATVSEAVIEDAAEAEGEEVEKAVAGVQREFNAEQSGEVEIPSCLLGGDHNNVWTDCGDYKVMKCSGCGQETGNKATNLGNGVFGYYDDAAAALLFNRTNDVRIGCELQGGLDDMARERALACASDFSHSDMQTAGECIAKGQSDADAVMDAWKTSEYHRNLLIDPIYLDGGTACLWYDAGDGNMQSIWVLVMD